MNNPNEPNLNETPIGFTHTLPGETENRQFWYYQNAKIVATEDTVMTQTGQTQVVMVYTRATDTDPKKKYIWDGVTTYRDYYDNGKQPPPQQQQAQHQAQHQAQPQQQPQPQPQAQPTFEGPCIEIPLQEYSDMQVLSKLSDFIIQFLASMLRKHVEPESEDIAFVEAQVREYYKQVMQIYGVPEEMNVPMPPTSESQQGQVHPAEEEGEPT